MIANLTGYDCEINMQCLWDLYEMTKEPTIDIMPKYYSDNKTFTITLKNWLKSRDGVKFSKIWLWDELKIMVELKVLSRWMNVLLIEILLMEPKLSEWFSRI